MNIRKSLVLLTALLFTITAFPGLSLFADSSSGFKTNLGSTWTGIGIWNDSDKGKVLAGTDSEQRYWARLYGTDKAISKEDFAISMKVSNFGELSEGVAQAQLYLTLGVSKINPTVDADGRVQIRIQLLNDSSSQTNVAVYENRNGSWTRASAWVAWPANADRKNFEIKAIGKVGQSDTSLAVYINGLLVTTGTLTNWNGGCFGWETYKACMGTTIESMILGYNSNLGSDWSYIGTWEETSAGRKLISKNRDWGRMFNKDTPILKENFSAVLEVSNFSGESAQCYLEFGIKDPNNPTTNAAGMAQVRIQNLSKSDPSNVALYYYDPDAAKWNRGSAWVAWPESVSRTDFVVKAVGTVGESSTSIDIYINNIKVVSGSYAFFDGGIFGATTYMADTGCLIRSLNVEADSLNKVLYTVAVDADEGGTVSGVPATAVEAGTSVTLTATPNSGYQFDGWYDGENRVSDSAEYTFVVDQNITLRAKFSLIPSYYSVKVNYDENGGSVTGIPESAVLDGTSVTLKASPKQNYKFDGWYKGTELVESSDEYTFTVRENLELTAKFTYIPVIGIEDGTDLLKQKWVSGYGKWEQHSNGLVLSENNDNLDSAVFLPTVKLNNTEFTAEIKVSGFKGAREDINNPVIMMFFGLNGDVPKEFPAGPGRIDARLQDQQASVYEWNPTTGKPSFATGRWQPVQFGEDFVLRIEMFRGNVTLYVDGVELYTWTLGRYLDEYTPGYIGFVTWGCAPGLTISQMDVKCSNMTVIDDNETKPSVPDKDDNPGDNSKDDNKTDDKPKNVDTGVGAPISMLTAGLAAVLTAIITSKKRKIRMV